MAKAKNEAPMPERMPPTLMLNEDDLPEIKDWKVGGKYQIALVVEQTSSSQGDSMMGPDRSKKMEARFRVISAASMGKARGEANEEADESGVEEKPSGSMTVIVRAVKSKLGVK